MIENILVFYFNQIITFNILSYLTINRRKPQKFQLTLLTIFITLLMAISFTLWQNSRKQNMYQLLNVPRVFNEADYRSRYSRFLRENHPDKKQGSAELFMQVKESKQIFTNKLFKDTYDRYGTFKIEVRENDQKMKIDQIGFFAGMEMYIHYMISFIMVLILTTENGMKYLKIQSIIALILSFLLDFFYFYGDQEYILEAGPLDMLFPDTTLQDRVNLNRILFGFLFVFLRVRQRIVDNYSYFYIRDLQDNIQTKYNQKIDNIENFLNDVETQQKSLQKNVENAKVASWMKFIKYAFQKLMSVVAFGLFCLTLYNLLLKTEIQVEEEESD